MKYFCLTFLIMSFLSFNISFAYDGNKTIESFNKSKKILRNIHKENPITFYCQCSYKKKIPEWESCSGRDPNFSDRRSVRDISRSAYHKAKKPERKVTCFSDPEFRW